LSQFFCYDADSSKYRTSSAILPGCGYWVRSAIPGRIILSANESSASAARIHTEAAEEVPPSPPDPESAVPAPERPLSFGLEQNYPNPFNPSTEFRFSVPATAMTTLAVYDLLGNRVATVVDEVLTRGRYVRQWDATGLPSGIYFYRLTTQNNLQTRKLLLVR